MTPAAEHDALVDLCSDRLNAAAVGLGNAELLIVVWMVEVKPFYSSGPATTIRFALASLVGDHRSLDSVAPNLRVTRPTKTALRILVCATDDAWDSGSALPSLAVARFMGRGLELVLLEPVTNGRLANSVELSDLTS